MRFRYFLDRAQEPSTWRGVTMLLTGLGIAVQPELMTAIASVGMGVAGVIGILTKDR